jgi:hypothetical protein
VVAVDLGQKRDGGEGIMNVRAIAGPGRGRKKTLRGKAMECAKHVLRVKDDVRMTRALRNWRYEMAYWGTAMRGHVAGMKKAGDVIDDKLAVTVAMAEEALRTHCDGQDCSFVKG